MMGYGDHKKGIILASYFNSTPDGQWGVFWKTDLKPLYALIKTCKNLDLQLVIFHDCFSVEHGGIFIKIPRQQKFSPNVYRWQVYHDFLKENAYPYVFMVDSTDVRVLRNPFNSIDAKLLYVGDEFNKKVDNYWMRTFQEPLLKIADYRKIISTHANHTLVNCGIVGGVLDIVMEYLAHQVNYHRKYTQGVLKSTDMAVFNYVIWKHFANRIKHGVAINTKFKYNEVDNGISLFKHK